MLDELLTEWKDKMSAAEQGRLMLRSSRLLCEHNVVLVMSALRAWQTMLELHGIAFDEDDYGKKADGRTQLDGVRAIMPDVAEPTAIAASEQNQPLFLDCLAQGWKMFESSTRWMHKHL